MPSQIPAKIEKLRDSIATIFDQVQISLANHRKNCVALCKLHSQAAKVTRPTKNGTAVKLVGEKEFGDAFVDMINRILVVKKGPATVDRIVKFVGSYVKYLNERGMWPCNSAHVRRITSPFAVKCQRKRQLQLR